jgi:hypothetical protein
MTRATTFDPYHLESLPLHILVRSLRPEVEILFRLEMCGVVCVLQSHPKRFFLHQRLSSLKLLIFYASVDLIELIIVYRTLGVSGLTVSGEVESAAAFLTTD